MADTIEPRVAVLEQIAKNTSERLDRMDARLDRIETRLDRIEGRQHDDFQILLGWHDRLLERHDRDFRWFVTLYLAGMATLLGVMAHGFRWL